MEGSGSFENNLAFGTLPEDEGAAAGDEGPGAVSAASTYSFAINAMVTKSFPNTR